MTTQNYPYTQWHKEHGSTTLMIQGDWCLTNYTALTAHIHQIKVNLPAPTQLDFSQLTALDTLGGQLLIELVGVHVLSAALQQSCLTASQQQLLHTLLQAHTRIQSTMPAAHHSSMNWRLMTNIAQLGQYTLQGWQSLQQYLAFIGLILSTLWTILWKPQRWRLTALVANLQQTGLNAVPIVMLLTFLVGAVVAYLGATLLTRFGANIYTVHLVAFSFLREFAPLLVAIIIAGRTASAFTAQIGSMRINEELDAIKVLGLSSIELLVLPRLLALLISLPLLTFIAMISGIVGGMMVANATLDISYTMFISVLQQNVELKHFWIGITKAPFFAFTIVIISCLEGFKVSGSAQSVGLHTTASVVQSIFMVIVIDAIFAVICMEMGW